MFDIIVSLILMFILLPFFIVVPLFIKFDSRGKIFFKQKRVTKLGKAFDIIKFRTMKEDQSSNIGLTAKNDNRITSVGRFLRKFKIDEFPQLLNILCGDMTFVGTRPEVEEFVQKYSKEMMATLLLPAGLTSWASIEFKNESDIMKDDVFYVNEILPKKMVHNLSYIRNINFFQDFKILLFTFIRVFS